jgi:hypothetical protein
MGLDYTKIQMTTAASSNKVILQGNDVIHVPALGGAGEILGTTTIPHNAGTDYLLFQVGATGVFSYNVMVPWISNDGRVTLYAMIDSTNLYVCCISEDASGLGSPAFDVSFFYRILIP